MPTDPTPRERAEEIEIAMHFSGISWKDAVERAITAAKQAAYKRGYNDGYNNALIANGREDS